MTNPTNISDVPAISKMPFRYDTLPNAHSFRILLLKPGNDHDTLRGSLITRSLGNPPSYQALSYVWGSANQTESLECDYQDFKITVSLNIALRRIRSPHDCIFVWADQICINQSNITERSQQVSMMKNIFSGADIVSAWLGPGDTEEIKLVTEAIIELAHQRTFYVKNPPVFPPDEELRGNHLPIRSSLVWAALNSLLRLPYFSRIWIIQEVVVSRAFRLLWGDFEIPGDIFTQGLENAFQNAMHRSDFTTRSPRLDLLRLSWIFWKTEDEPSDLLKMILMTRMHQATDVRDKIFALIGLSKDCDIVPDYSQTEASLFKEFTLQEITRSGLKILGYANVTNPVEATKPLWVPRWWPPNDKVSRSLMNLGFNASNGYDMIRDMTFNSQFLVLKGLHIDGVKAVSDLVSHDVANVLAISSFFEVVTRNEELFQKKYGPEFIRPFLLTMLVSRTIETCLNSVAMSIKDDTYLDAFICEAFSTLFNKLRYTEPEVNITRDESISILSLLRAAVNASPTTTTGTPKFKEDNTFEFFRAYLERLYPENDEQVSLFYDVFKRMSRSPRDEDEVERWQFNKVFLEITRPLRFFITESGYIGLGPPCMKDGDSVCILFGSTTPYIVRPTSIADEYLFLGESYVHGLMEGEAVTIYKAQELSTEQRLIEKWFRLI